MSRGKGSLDGSVLRRLSGEPGPTLGERILHHGSRIALLLAVAGLVTFLFPTNVGMNVGGYEEGMVAPEDVIAQIEFEVPKTEEELTRDRAVAMESVPPTYDVVSEAADTMAGRITAFFNAVDSAAAGDRAALEEVLRTGSITATDSQLLRLMDRSIRSTLRRAALRAAREILPQGVADASQALDITTATVTVRRGPEIEESVPAEEFLTSRDFLDQAMDMLPRSSAPEVAELLRLILVRNIEFSYVLNVVATEGDRDAVAQLVPTHKETVIPGQAIVRAADLIEGEDVERLLAYEDELRNQGLMEERSRRLGPTFGSFLLNAGLLTIFALSIFFTRPVIYANFRWLLLIAMLVATYFVAAAAIAGNGLPVEWLPISFVALPVAILWETRVALVLALVLAALTGALPPFAPHGTGTVMLVMAGGAAAAMSVRAVRRRSETWVSIAIISAATALVLFGHGLTVGTELSDIAEGALKAGANATVSALLATGFLFFFELFTGVTTDQTLLEWADPTRPLLKRLSLEAPGSYAHTINVANLAEAASAAIGANGLLCRVGVYYHDVGKMLKPHYFVENQPDARNPHDKLKPETSATIVKEHVTEGVRLARDAKVPEVVTQFILEHHGTQRIGFFYEKALEEAEGGEVDVEKFTYPGPKPRSRETAIVMLADSCESAARVLKDPTPERVRGLIDNIVDGKVAAGQLDEAPLTLKEISEVKNQFEKILLGVAHHRLEYPSTRHLTEAPDGEVGGKDEPGEDGAAETGGKPSRGDEPAGEASA